MNNIKKQYRTKKPTDKTLYAREYYNKNRARKKEYYDNYYKTHREYIRQYAQARKAKIPTFFERENKQVIINLN